jgi:pimeloyl-ACP methyl ester carboxylesterase
VVENPSAFASAVPICSVVGPFNSSGPLVPDAQLAAIDTPTWLITSADDTTVDPQANTVHAHELIPGSIMSLYQNVTWDGYNFPGHWSWIYPARNDPSHQGVSLWKWMAEQQR